MNKKLLFSLFVVLSLMLPVVSVMAGTCGKGNDCQYCLTEGTCIAKSNCAWVGEACEFAGIMPLTSGTIATALTYIKTLWTDFEKLIIVAVGLPVAFWIIKKGIGLVKAR